MTVDSIPNDLPALVADRVLRHRRRMSTSTLVLVPGDRVQPDSETLQTADSVLAIQWPEQSVSGQELTSLRRSVRPGVRLVMLVRQEPRPRRGARRPSGSVVASVRNAGWTIASMERFAVDGEIWMDLTAIDLDRERDARGV
ncbi:MAG: hypothetical protein ACR2P0_19225 [Acidimicrobiales bacterium]